VSVDQRIVQAVFGQLISFDKDGVDPGYGSVSVPLELPDGSWLMTLKDLGSMSVPVARVLVTPPVREDVS
jgi:hypothetical protein